MAILKWDETGERLYETGVDKCVLYVYDPSKTDEGRHPYSPGVAWNGITGVTESPDGAESEDLYADNVKYLSLLSAETMGLTLTAYMYPDEFAICDGTAELIGGIVVGQQARRSFGLAYRTLVGNDTQGTDHGYKLHLVYGCRASVAQKDYNTVNENPDAVQFSWDITTTPVDVPGLKPTSHITIDSTKVDPTELAALEAILYGGDDTEARLPLPTELKTIFKKTA